MPLMTISAPGVYSITSDMTQANPSDHAIYVNPGIHNVTIVLYSRLVGAGGSASTNCGIYAPYSANLSIVGLGGNIRGFGYGVRGDNNDLCRVSGLFVQDGWFRGICLTGNDMMVADNYIRSIAGATWTPDAYCMGIEVSGTDANGNGKPKVLRNAVQDITGVGTGESVGISITDKGLGGIIQNNIVRNSALPPDGSGPGNHASFGLWIGGNSDVFAAGNTIDTWQFGIAYSSPPTGEVDGNHYRNCRQNILDSQGDVVLGDGVVG